MVERAQGGGDPSTDQVTQGADSELPGWQPKENATKLPQESRNSVGGISAREGRGPKDPSVRGEGTQGPWRHGATGCSMLSRQLLATKRVDGRTHRPVRHLRVTPRQEVRGVDGLSLCVSSGMQVEVYLLPKALDENVKKLHIPHSVQSSPSLLKDKAFQAYQSEFGAQNADSNTEQIQSEL